MPHREIQAQLYEEQPYYRIDVPRNVVAVQDRVGGASPGPWSAWHNVRDGSLVE